MIMLTTVITLPAFATENAVDTAQSTEISPHGVLSGYGQVWFDPNTMSPTGSFQFNVSGMSWPNAEITFKFENFNLETKFDIEVVNKNGVVVFRRVGIDRSYDDYNNLKIFPGSTGTYTVYYKFYGTLSPGRINVWIS